MSTETYPIHKESFDVVLLKDGVAAESASSADFERVPVIAESPLAAQMSDGARRDGYTPIFAVPTGHQTQPEVMARQRELNGPGQDRSEILAPVRRNP